MKRLITLVAAAGLAALALVWVVALGGTDRRSQPPGVTITPLVHATIGDRVRASSAGIRIRTRGPKDMLVASILVEPGGSFGWHSHPGPVFVGVESGTLALYMAHQGHCRRTSVGPGQAFVEDGGAVHLARNEGSTPIQIYATFLARRGTQSFLTEELVPRACRS